MRTILVEIETDNKNSYFDIMEDLQERLISINYYYKVKDVCSVLEFIEWIKEGEK